jgi:hypothetical protein
VQGAISDGVTTAILSAVLLLDENPVPSAAKTANPRTIISIISFFIFSLLILLNFPDAYILAVAG